MSQFEGFVLSPQMTHFTTEDEREEYRQNPVTYRQFQLIYLLVNIVFHLTSWRPYLRSFRKHKDEDDKFAYLTTAVFSPAVFQVA